MFSKKGRVDIGRGEASEAPDHNVAVEVVPLENGPWTDAQSLPNRRWNRNLSLARDLGVGEDHMGGHYRGNESGQSGGFHDFPSGAS